MICEDGRVYMVHMVLLKIFVISVFNDSPEHSTLKAIFKRNIRQVINVREEMTTPSNHIQAYK